MEETLIEIRDLLRQLVSRQERNDIALAAEKGMQMGKILSDPALLRQHNKEQRALARAMNARRAGA